MSKSPTGRHQAGAVRRRRIVRPRQGQLRLVRLRVHLRRLAEFAVRHLPQQRARRRAQGGARATSASSPAAAITSRSRRRGGTLDWTHRRPPVPVLDRSASRWRVRARIPGRQRLGGRAGVRQPHDPARALERRPWTNLRVATFRSRQARWPRWRAASRCSIYTHDNPDPDALAAALGLQRLAEHELGIDATLTYGGIVGRAQNRAMVENLKMPLDAGRSVSTSVTFDTIALVDSQPETGNNSLPHEHRIDIVIDHHPLRPGSARAAWCDIRPDLGATSTIVFEYLRQRAVPIDAPLATAFFFALRTETRDLGRESTEAERRAYLALVPLVDHDLLYRMTHPKVPRAHFAALDRALRSALVFGDLVAVNLGALGLSRSGGRDRGPAAVLRRRALRAVHGPVRREPVPVAAHRSRQRARRIGHAPGRRQRRRGRRPRHDGRRAAVRARHLGSGAGGDVQGHGATPARGARPRDRHRRSAAAASRHRPVGRPGAVARASLRAARRSTARLPRAACSEPSAGATSWRDSPK